MTDRPAATPVVEFSDVRLSFGNLTAIDGVDFTVDEDELFAIIGPNGAGKTSIFNVLSGVYRPQEGSVRLRGRELIGMRPHRIARLGVARTFQNVELFANLTLVDNLMLGRHVKFRYGTLAAIAWLGQARHQEEVHRAAVEEIIDLLELQAWRTLPVGLLPYGIQKRIELGRALAMEPEILLLDEPVAGMNLEETEDTARFLLSIRQEYKTPMILVEHDMSLVMDIADRVLAIDFGAPLALGSPAEVQSHPAVVEAYLGGQATASAADGAGS